MAIRQIKEAEQLRKYCERLGRLKVAERIIEIAKRIAEERDEDTYQGTLKLAGMIRALCVGCKYDTYWDEKQFLGFQKMLEEAEMSNLKHK